MCDVEVCYQFLLFWVWVEENGKIIGDKIEDQRGVDGSKTG